MSFKFFLSVDERYLRTLRIPAVGATFTIFVHDPALFVVINLEQYSLFACLCFWKI
jgi:hypothetical protein